MKITMRLVLIICIAAVFAHTTVFGAPESKKESPVAATPEPGYEFAPVPEGSEVIHDYVVQNKGTAPLIISQIKTG